MPFRKQNLEHIKTIFSEKTGTDLVSVQGGYSRRTTRTALVLAAVLALCLTFAAFTYPLFSPLAGDALSLSAIYEGNGIVTVCVENRSRRDLEFEEQLKLFRWRNSEEIPPLSDAVIFEGTRFPAHSSGTMTVDLSAAYDIEALETEHPAEWYYLVLTNYDFLFGHDWMCTVSFQPDAPIQEEVQDKDGHVSAVASQVEAIDEALRFYFEDAYADTLPAFNGANFQYLQAVQEYLVRFDGRVVSPVAPSMIVGGPADTKAYPIVAAPPADIIFDNTYPAERQYELVGENYHILDGYGRLFGATETEKALVLSALLPGQKGDVGTGVEMPLIYLYTYEKAAIESRDNYAFIYGQLITFAELEPCKVYEVDQYVVYNATGLIYTDLDAYIGYFRAVNEGRIYFDASVGQRIQNIYDYYMNNGNIGSLFYYPQPQA